jgi:hypothetical protein
VNAGPTIRVVSVNVDSLRGDPAALAAMVRSVEPDVAILQDGPRRLRWRTRSADLARQFGLVYAGGGEPALGNLILTNLRVAAQDAWYVQFPLTPGRRMDGAAVVRCSVAGSEFVVAGTRLATEPALRPAQAAILTTVLSDVDTPIVLGADLGEDPGGPAGRRLAEGLTGVDTGTGPAAIFISRLQVEAARAIDTPQAQRATRYPATVVTLRLPV